jgi:hypothetical protein
MSQKSSVPQHHAAEEKIRIVRVVMMAFEQPELSPRELATRCTDTNSYYVSESSVYRLLKAHDLIGSPAFIVIKAADEFKEHRERASRHPRRRVQNGKGPKV